MKHKKLQKKPTLNLFLVLRYYFENGYEREIVYVCDDTNVIKTFILTFQTIRLQLIPISCFSVVLHSQTQWNHLFLTLQNIIRMDVAVWTFPISHIPRYCHRFHYAKFAIFCGTISDYLAKYIHMDTTFVLQRRSFAFVWHPA